MDVFASFFNLLYSVRVEWEGEDKLWWAPSNRGLFDVRSFYSILVCNAGIIFPWKRALGKILTHDNLRRRGIVVVEWCVMCKKYGESVDHLLLHCDVARVVWSSFYSLFEMEWAMTSSVLDLLSGWSTLLGCGSVNRRWKQVPLCVL